MEQPGEDEGRSPAHRGNRARGPDQVLEKRLARRPDLPGKQIGRERIGRLGPVEVGVRPPSRNELVVELQVGLATLGMEIDRR